MRARADRPRAATRPTRLSVATAGLAAAAFLLAAPAGAQETGAPVDPSLFEDMDWRSVGPSRGGRVTAVAGHRSHPHTFYMGSTGGGVWRTTDYGHTWHNISDAYFDATAAIGAIRVADSDPDVIYVGTGSDGIRSNVITGRGVYRSTDGGESWEHVGLEDAGQIGRMAVDPNDPERVFAAALGSPFGTGSERGVFRSTDGGDSWEKVLFIADSVGVYGLEMAPDDPNTLYASAWRGERKPWTIISGMEYPAGGGIYRSTDGGESWRKVGDGLPSGLIGKIDLAVSAADPDRVYALVEAPEPHEGLYRSDDRGETWEHVNDREGLMARPFYYTNVTADPTDADVVYVNNEGFYRSTDGGESFERRRTPHGDNHDMWINPDDPDVFIQSNDGGANVTLDGGETWSTQHNQPTAELYQVDVDDRFPYWLYAGQQDNSTIAVPSLPPAEPAPSGPEGWWKAIGGCETGPAVPQPGSDPLVVFANCKGRFGKFDMRTGQEQQYYVGAEYMYGTNPANLIHRFQRTVPIEISPHDPGTVYHGSQFVNRTTDGGRTWEQISPDLTAFRPERQVVSGTPITRDITGEEHYSTLYVIEESPHRRGVLWVGANDGPVHVSRDGGGSWTDVTPPEMPPEGRINAIEISPHAPDKVYVAGYRFLLDDWAPYVYRTTDGGESWTLLTPGDNGIPSDYPVRVVREDPEREGLLYAGTEFGIFVSFDDGARWQPLQLDLPVTPITDIEVHEKDLAISTMGRGFWILDDLSPLHQAGPEVASSRAHLYRPRAAYRMRYRGAGGYFGDDPPHEPEYPGPGVWLDYYLGDDAASEVTLEILDASGDVVRGYSSSDEGYTYRQVQGMREARTVREGDLELETSTGHHRVRWDLRHTGAWEPEGEEGGGPMVLPGDYEVRLSVGDWSATRPLEVRMDPRVREAGVTLADLRAQEELNLRIRTALTEARRAAHRIQEMEETLEGSGRGGQALRDLQELEAEIVTEPEDDVSSYPRPMLVDQIQYLYGMTARADQRPGRDAYTRFETLRNELDDALDRLESIRGRVADAVEGGR